LLNDEAAALLQKSGNRLGLASLQMNRAEAFFADGDDGEALASAREAEAVFRELGDERELATVLLNLSAYRLALGRLNEAWSNAHEALPVVLHAEESILTAVAVEHLAQVAAETGDPERAARLLGYADAVYRELGYVREPTERRGYEHALELIRAALPEDRIASLLAAGEAMDQEAAVAAALAIPQPGTPHATQTAG
jgi:tetratricopeptide (TPR) repeat protein